MDKASLTIVVPVFNRAAVVQRTLDSIYAQTLRPLEVVLVDNASTDGSLAVLESWRDRVDSPDFRVRVVGESVAGAWAARNAGLGIVRTEWTMFFDSDDTMRPGHCHRALDVVRGNASVDIVGWDVVQHNADGAEGVHRFYVRNAAFHNLFHGSMSTQRYMARTVLFRRAGCWAPDVTGWDDVELGMRLLRLHPRMIHAGREVTVDVWFSAESITGTDYSSGVARFETSLDRMETYATSSLARAVRLKRMILAGDVAAEGAHDTARRLYCRTIGDEPSRLYRILLRTAYAYVSRGGRGVARLLARFYKINL